MKIGIHASATALLQHVEMMHTVQYYTGMTHTVQLHCPINAQIGPLDGQTDSRILL